ncbi:MAG: hypothetical protein GF350_02315 [Chitinivibrionales bacterium]|nr:hypothetical protein [Chitinivibrionales bacterium]
MPKGKNMRLKIAVFCFLALLPVQSFSSPAAIHIDCARKAGEFTHFWRSTGFDPASRLLDPDYKQYMSYIGSIPRGSFYVRPHYLLELLKGTGLLTENPSYDWTQLDEALDVLHGNGLKLIFEIMGNPEGQFTNYEDDTQARAWRRLVKDLADRYAQRYGSEELRSWYWETWNEPDIGFWQQSRLALLIYTDACSEGLNDADPQLRWGGPGAAGGDPYFWLDHCTFGQNYFTQQTGTRVDFISVHRKFRATEMVNRELEIISKIRADYPQFAEVPFLNDEADVRCCWRDDLWWRPLPNKAAFICNSINQHLVRIVDSAGVDYPILSNDNGFWGVWNNRTQLVRFGDENRFAHIKKPSHNVMVMLSLLGHERCTVTNAPALTGGIGCITTRDSSDNIAVLLYNEDLDNPEQSVDSIQLTIDNIPFGSAALVHYRIDASHTNPYALWPTDNIPEVDTLRILRERQELERLEDPVLISIAGGSLTKTVALPLNSVSLLMLCRKPEQPPSPVTTVTVEEYTGVHDNPEYLVKWDGVDFKAIKTYEVLYAENENGPFRRINVPDIICTAFLHSGPSTQGYYRVQPVDLWARIPEISPVHRTGTKRNSAFSKNTFQIIPVLGRITISGEKFELYDIAGKKIAFGGDRKSGISGWTNGKSPAGGIIILKVVE